MRQPLTLLQVVRLKWFDIPVKASDIMIRKIWGNYQIQNQFLKDITATLLASPFTNHVELSNFISGVGDKSRRIYRVGPPIYAYTFMCQMQQLISRSYKLGYKLYSLPKYSAAQLHDKRESLAVQKALNLASFIPIPKERKYHMQRILKLRDMSSDEASMLRLPSWLMKLAFIQKVVKGNIEMVDVIPKLLHLKMGIVVTFLREQEKITYHDPYGKQKTKWVGPGELLVSLEDYTASIMIEDDQVRTIVIDNISAARRKPFLLQEVFNIFDFKIEKYRATYSARRGESWVLTAKFDGQSFIPATGLGTTVFIDPTLSMTLLSYEKLSIDYNYGEICITGSQYRDSRPIKLISYKFYLDKIDYPQSPARVIPCRSLWSGWIKFAPVEPSSVWTMINNIKSSLDIDPENTDYLVMKHWLKEFLLKRLSSYRGLGAFSAERIEQATDISSNDPALLKMISMMEITCMGGAFDIKDIHSEKMTPSGYILTPHLQDEHIEEPLVDDIGVTIDNLDNMLGVKALNIQSYEEGLLYYHFNVHPLLNKFISIFEECNAQFWQLLLDGTLCQGCVEEGKFVAYILDIKIHEERIWPLSDMLESPDTSFDVLEYEDEQRMDRSESPNQIDLSLERPIYSDKQSSMIDNDIRWSWNKE